MARLFYLPAIAVFLFCCKPADRSPNKFSDAGLIRIADLKDRRLADSLIPYFSHENALYRRDAASAFGSIQDAEYTERIGRLLLMDSDADVRGAAAFALGQIQHPSSERLLLAALVKEKDPEVTYEILQAYGKTTRRWQLDPALYRDDTLKAAGLAWSLYRAGLRGKADATASDVAVELMGTGYSENTRLGAAHYFGRAAKGIEGFENAIRTTAQEDPSAEVRMAAAMALGKSPSDSALHTLKEIIKNESDERVIVNALRALAQFPFRQIKHYLYESLGHDDVHVGITASEVIIKTITPEEWIEVSSLINRVDHWRIQANLYEAALKAGHNEDLAAEVRAAYEKSINPYERAALLGSLKHFASAYDFIVDELRAANIPVIRTAAAASLVAMNQTENFPSALTGRFAALYQDLLQTEEDAAVLGTIATALADSALNYRQHIRDASFLKSAKQKLSLPEHNEALQSIEAAIAHLEKRAPVAVKNKLNHPIDWQLVKKIPDDLRATIQTSRGSIIVRLLVNEAPGSVANFVALAQDDYFDSLFVHRVVPNFVIQDGCKRGDGWGSEDYSIRSEFAPRPYSTGSLGMASAGKDTEGTQWFITHTPTPHLDGRYTLFGLVIEGQVVADYLEIGDRIIDVEIGDFTDQ